MGVPMPLSDWIMYHPGFRAASKSSGFWNGRKGQMDRFFSPLSKWEEVNKTTDIKEAEFMYRAELSVYSD